MHLPPFRDPSCDDQQPAIIPSASVIRTDPPTRSQEASTLRPVTSAVVTIDLASRSCPYDRHIYSFSLSSILTSSTRQIGSPTTLVYTGTDTQDTGVPLEPLRNSTGCLSANLSVRLSSISSATCGRRGHGQVQCRAPRRCTEMRFEHLRGGGSHTASHGGGSCCSATLPFHCRTTLLLPLARVFLLDRTEHAG
ncbi:hypothetical protein LIA77_02549 [Sarocladium implicatum]|nr:hypothetical protein LIA77_02549 [Sarocladium implicatum]